MAGIIATLANRGTHLVAPLVVHTVDQFEPQELLDFFGFLGMLAHRLRVGPLIDEALVRVRADRSRVLSWRLRSGTFWTNLFLFYLTESTLYSPPLPRVRMRQFCKVT